MSDNDENISPLREAAISTHELYKEFRAAGFTRSEAIELIARVTVTMLSTPTDGSADGDS